MAPLDPATLDVLDRADEVDVQATRRDGSPLRIPIWIVVADGDAYVRSYRGESGRWYQRARRDGRLTLDAGGNRIPMTVEPVGGEELNRRVSDAFRAKYGARSPGPTEEMLTPEVTATTMRLGAA
jgi:hypothetical protein